MGRMAWTMLFGFVAVLKINMVYAINKVLFRKENGIYLQNSTIRTIYAKNKFECGAFCSNEPLCVSVNYKKSGKDKGRCELNNKILEKSSQKNCLKNQEFSYFEVVKQECKKKLKYYHEALLSSFILEGNKGYVEQLSEWLKDEKIWRLCYRASKDGWRAVDFHTHCDNKGSTITIVRVGDYIFGGYSDIPWGGSGGFKKSASTFLFSFRNKDNLAPFKSPVQNPDKSIFNDPDGGPGFGDDDLFIGDNANASSNSISTFGKTYQLPLNYSYPSSVLAGTKFFRVTEFEVYC